MKSPEGFCCKTCGQFHAGMAFSFAAQFPDMYANLSPAERDARCAIGSDHCTVDSEWFFVRGLVEIPIIGSEEPFLWGLWASIRGEIFDEIASSWNEVGREKKYGTYKGRLGNSLSVYPQTLNLKLKIVLQQVGNSPLFFVEDEQHVLGTQQKTGITLEQAVELASTLLHFGSRPGHV